MTRVNANIPPENLIDKHLMAEFFEMTRIAAQLQKRINSGKGLPENVPQQLKLGSGHQSFFLDKGLFIHKRYDALYAELVDRGYNITAQFDWSTFYSDKQEYYNDYQMSITENQLLIDRLSERLHAMKNLKYWGEPISVDDAVKLLNS